MKKFAYELGQVLGQLKVAAEDKPKNPDEEGIKKLRALYGRGGRGACGGVRRFDGSGKGVGNRGTPRQPKPQK